MIILLFLCNLVFGQGVMDINRNYQVMTVSDTSGVKTVVGTCTMLASIGSDSTNSAETNIYDTWIVLGARDITMIIIYNSGSAAYIGIYDTNVVDITDVDAANNKKYVRLWTPILNNDPAIFNFNPAMRFNNGVYFRSSVGQGSGTRRYFIQWKTGN